MINFRKRSKSLFYVDVILRDCLKINFTFLIVGTFCLRVMHLLVLCACVCEQYVFCETKKAHGRTVMMKMRVSLSSVACL